MIDLYQPPKPAIIRPAEHKIIRPGDPRFGISQQAMFGAFGITGLSGFGAGASAAAGEGNDAFTKLLLHCDGADASTTFTDSSSLGHTITRSGTVEVDTAQSKFGGASALFAGSGGLQPPDHADLEPSNADFTIDFWVRCSSWSGTQALFMKGDNADYWTGFYASGTTLSFTATTNNGGYNFANYSSGGLTNNTWQHIAASRVSNGLHIFLDGTLLTAIDVGTLTMHNFAHGWGIGVRNDGGIPFSGWMEEIRFSKGIGRWTATFTPPTSAYS